jgi:hypothetical protein
MCYLLLRQGTWKKNSWNNRKPFTLSQLPYNQFRNVSSYRLEHGTEKQGTAEREDLQDLFYFSLTWK